jgi:hypothetical protein
MEIAYFVQRVEGRPEWETSKKHLDASDIPSYTEIVQLPGDTVRETFVRTLQAMEDSGADLCVRFEDDLDGVNKRFDYNLRRWGALTDHRFGIGWLFVPGGSSYTLRGRTTWRQSPIHCSLAIAIKKKDLPEIRKYVDQFMETRPSQDMSLSYAVITKMDRQIAIHNPSLVEHSAGESIMGHIHGRFDFCGNFDGNWVR